MIAIANASMAAFDASRKGISPLVASPHVGCGSMGLRIPRRTPHVARDCSIFPCLLSHTCSLSIYLIFDHCDRMNRIRISLGAIICGSRGLRRCVVSHHTCAHDWYKTSMLMRGRSGRWKYCSVSTIDSLRVTCDRELNRRPSSRASVTCDRNISSVHEFISEA